VLVQGFRLTSRAAKQPRRFGPSKLRASAAYGVASVASSAALGRHCTAWAANGPRMSSLSSKLPRAAACCHACPLGDTRRSGSGGKPMLPLPLRVYCAAAKPVGRSRGGGGGGKEGEVPDSTESVRGEAPIATALSWPVLPLCAVARLEERCIGAAAAGGGAEGHRCSSSTRFVDVGRSPGSWLRQRSISAATSGGHSSGTLCSNKGARREAARSVSGRRKRARSMRERGQEGRGGDWQREQGELNSRAEARCHLHRGSRVRQYYRHTHTHTAHRRVQHSHRVPQLASGRHLPSDYLPQQHACKTHVHWWGGRRYVAEYTSKAPEKL
jgi:hypothetical protein